MEILVEMVTGPIEAPAALRGAGGGSGATLEFRGIVRDEEAGQAIRALRYEAYETMARAEMRRILAEEAAASPCERVVVIHRHGWVGVGEAAIFVGIESRHRAEAIALLANFLDRLKRDVPIWKAETR